MVRQLNPPQECPNCGSEKSFTRDERTVCYMCYEPLVSHVSVKAWNQEPPVGMMDRIEALKSKVTNSEHLTLLWQKLGNTKVLISGSLVGVLLLGSGIVVGTRNIASTSALGTGQTLVLGDSFGGYSALRDDSFQENLKQQGITLVYAHEYNQAVRAQRLSSDADLIVTTLDQALRHHPEGKIVSLWDTTHGADAAVLNTKKFPLLKSIDALKQEVEIALQSGQKYSLVYAAGTPSEYLALLLANKFPGFRLEDFNQIQVDDASEAYKLLQDPAQNIAIAILWEPFVTKARQLGHQPVLTSADVPETIIDVLIASDEMIENRPDELRRVIAAQYARVNASRLDSTALKLQIAKDGEISEAEAGTVLRGIDFFRADEANQWFTTGILDQKIEFTSAILAASGRLAQLPEDPTQFYTNEFLDVAIANSIELDKRLALDNPPAPQAAPKPAKVQAAAPIGKISEDITFELSSVLLDPGDKQALDTVVETAKGFGGNTAIQITGHTSASGSPERNTVLSKGRVESVAQYLKGKQFTGDLIVKRVGSESPLPGIDPADARNQRVEVEVVRTGG